MRSHLIFLFAAATLGLACGSSTSDSPPTAAQASSDLATAACDRMVKCQPDILEDIYGDAATCVRILSAEEQVGSSLPGLGYTPADVEACAKAVAAQACNAPANSVPSACNWSGTVKTGGACSSTAQCVAGDACSATSQACGTCVVLPKAGEPCPTDECATGLVCDFDDPSGPKCTTPVPAGGACDLTHPCDAELQCTSGKCATLLGAGAACDAGTDDCDYEQGLYCGANATCAKYTFAAVGQPCGTVNGAQVLCIGTGTGASCVPSATGNGSEGTCVAPLADGQACSETSPSASCTPPSRCVSGVCAQPAAPVCSAVDGGI